MKKIISIVFLLCLFSPSLVAARSNPVSTERQQFQEKAREFRESKAENVKNKEELRSQVLSRAKTLAVKSVDRLISRYNHFLGVVENMANISAQNKAEYKSKIEAEIAKLKAKKTEISAATTSVEVKAIMETVKVQAKQSNQAVKLMLIAIKKSHMEKVIARINGVITRLETKIAENQNLGKDVTEHNSLLSEAKSYVALAQAKIAENSITETKDSLISAKNSLSKLTVLLTSNEEE